MELMKKFTSVNKLRTKKITTKNNFTRSKAIALFTIAKNGKKLKKQTFGFTLVNLLIALSISGILASSGIPAIFQSIYYIRASASYDELFTLIQFTRLQAVNYHSPVLLCPTIDNINCINDWSQRLMIFVDTNDDKTNDASEELLRIKTKLNKDESIKWNAAGSRRYLRFKADGSTGNQNGRLSYCLNKGSTLYAKQIIMTMAGRARRGSDESAIEKCNA
jgi:type IV fimbrial biogenesis protein FimT